MVVTYIFIRFIIILSNLLIIDNEHICKVYEYVENTESKQNFISMELLGKKLGFLCFLSFYVTQFLKIFISKIGQNLEKVKRNYSDGKLSRVFATHILVTISLIIKHLDTNARCY